jgi:uncharacterized membrane protein
MTTMTVVSVFSDKTNAEEAIKILKEDGYNPKDISIVMKDSRESKEMAEEMGTGTVGGAVSGATGGAILGGIAGLIASYMLPGLGAFFIGGPIAAALGLTGAAASTASGAATGAVAGGLLGALTGFGLTKSEAESYRERVEGGGILVAVPARDGDEMRVESTLRKYQAQDIKTVSAHGGARQPKEEFGSRTQSGYAMAGSKGGQSSASRRSRRAKRR